MKKVKIELYKWEGKFWPFEIKMHCGECSLNEGVIKQAIEEFGEDSTYIDFIEKPWLTNWYKVILKGGYHAPIVLVNGKVIGQEKVLTKERIKDEIMKVLYSDYEIPKGVHIFSKPGCKYCRLAKEIMKRNKIKYEDHNVMENSVSMIKLLTLVTGKIHPITLPQIFINGVWVKGAENLEKLEKEGKLKGLL
jgi:glutaredoxin